ncbi:unnamed protein product, partial [Mesorhabditis spiculigera]
MNGQKHQLEAKTARQRLADRKKQDSSTSGLPSTFVPGFHEEAVVRRMPYRILGNTGLKVSVVSFGSAAIGGLFGDIDDSISEMIESALKQGINLIDTAYWYGQARSESILGKLHDVEFDPTISIVLNETLQALEMARASGKVRHLGIAGYPLKKIRAIIENSPAKIDVVLTYSHATLNDNSLGEVVPFFQSVGIAVLNGSPLSMGLLSSEGPPPWHPANQQVREAVLAAEEYVHSKNLRLERLALDYSMHFPGTVSCLVGIGSMIQLDEAIRIGETCDGKRSTSLSEVERRVRDRIMRRHFDALNNQGWEGVDVARYWKRLKTLGLGSLATHRRHASVESLASTLNGLSMDSFSEFRKTPGNSMSRASSVVPISGRMEAIEENRRLRRPFLAKETSRDFSWKP